MWYHYPTEEGCPLKTAKIAYVRVSTVEQNEARQKEALEKYEIDKWYIEKVSAKDTNRPEFKKMMEFVREGDTIYIHDFSRIARSTTDLLDIVERLQAKGVHLVSNKENIDTSTPTGKLMLTMIGAIDEFERTNLLERQKEGIAIAVREGKYKGRKPVDIKDFSAHYDRYMRREVTKAQLAIDLDVSRPTLNKLIQEHEKSHASA
ncbi:MAG: recombinase family protein [Clostridiales bacterium]|jgi:DNA invertase Pin-like site-specific DNA recombinase|nr:recombinase family protein [Clostridiales bacterium]